MGMVGGGEGAFIGAVHRMAAALDGEIELVCGAFSSDPERARRSGAAVYLPDNRVYRDYTSMISAEATLPEISVCNLWRSSRLIICIILSRRCASSRLSCAV